MLATLEEIPPYSLLPTQLIPQSFFQNPYLIVNSRSKQVENQDKPSKMLQLILFASKPEDLHLIPGTYMVEDNLLSQVIL